MSFPWVKLEFFPAMACATSFSPDTKKTEAAPQPRPYIEIFYDGPAVERDQTLIHDFPPLGAVLKQQKLQRNLPFSQRLAPNNPTLYPASRNRFVALALSTSNVINPTSGTNIRITRITFVPVP